MEIQSVLLKGTSEVQMIACQSLAAVLPGEVVPIQSAVAGTWWTEVTQHANFSTLKWMHLWVYRSEMNVLNTVSVGTSLDICDDFPVLIIFKSDLFVAIH